MHRPAPTGSSIAEATALFYIDTSSLLKLLIPEPESLAVQAAVDVIVLSSLTELEAEIQFRAGRLGGSLGRAQYRRLTERLALLKRRDPFELRPLPASVFETALRQHRADQAPHVRTIDRLHLAAMEELGVRRLMTHDTAQATGRRLYGVRGDHADPSVRVRGRRTDPWPSWSARGLARAEVQPRRIDGRRCRPQRRGGVPGPPIRSATRWPGPPPLSRPCRRDRA